MSKDLILVNELRRRVKQNKLKNKLLQRTLLEDFVVKAREALIERMVLKRLHSDYDRTFYGKWIDDDNDKCIGFVYKSKYTKDEGTKPFNPWKKWAFG